jgi:prolyl-tRNA synthetase
VPHRVVLGERGLKEGMAEYQGRRDATATKIPLGELAAFVAERLRVA